MGKRTNDTKKTDPSNDFAVDEAAPEQDTDDADHSEIDEIEFDAGPPPIGIQPLMLAEIVPVKGRDAVWFKFALEAPEFEGLDTFDVWVEPKKHDDIARVKGFCMALGHRWDPARKMPVGGLSKLLNRRCRGVISVYEKDDGTTEFQIAKYKPSFKNDEGNMELREAFLASCEAAGVACELEQIDKPATKYHKRWQAKGKLFGGCGLLPVAQ